MRETQGVREEGTCKERLGTERRWPLVEEVTRQLTRREVRNLRGQCVCLSCGMTGKAGMKARSGVLGLERFGVIFRSFLQREQGQCDEPEGIL